MKYTKIAVLMVIPVVALALFGANMRLPAAQAKVSKVLTITKINCLMLPGNVNWDGANDVIDHNDSIVGLQTCSDLGSEGNFRNLIRVLGGDPDDPKPEDLAKVDLDAGQVHQEDGHVYVVAFVGNDDPVGFYTDDGILTISGSSVALCSSLPGADFEDEDCDGDGVRGDGVVVTAMEPQGADRGTGEFTVRQDAIQETAPYTIVGEAHDISIKSFDAAVQTGAPVCELFSDTPSFLAILTEPETTPIVATVTDVDGTAITGAIVIYAADDWDKAQMVVPSPLYKPLTPTVDLQALGIGSPEVLCGIDDPGTVKISATTTDGLQDVGAGLDPNARIEHTSMEVIVQSPPVTMALAGVPPSLVCDGTASSNVSAKLSDEDEKAVVNGNLVHFRVEALGSVNPIDARSTDGAATTALTPLANIASGVAIHGTWMKHVTKGATPTPYATVVPGVTPAPTPYPVPTQRPTDLKFVASDLEQTALVSCEQTAGTVPEVPPAGSPGAVISPPSTGDGGSQAPSWWVALPLGAVVLLLAGSGLALRRRTQ